MKTVLTMFLVLSSLASWASEKATVQQMKGKKAILRFDNDIPFSQGQQVYVNSGEGTQISSLSGQRNLLERKNSISLSASLSNKSSKVSGRSSVNTSTMTSTVRYGWNMQQYEFGPLVNVEVSDNGTTEVTSLGVGGFFEYNLYPNVSGQEFVAGPYAEVTTGSYKSDNGTTSTTYSPLTLNVGGFAKWFYLSPVLAFRGDIYYSYQSANSTKIQGLVFGIGLNNYF